MINLYSKGGFLSIMATYKYYIKTGVNGETQEVNFNAVDSSIIEGKTLEQSLKL